MFRSFEIKSDLVTILHEAVLHLELLNEETYSELVSDVQTALGSDYVVKFAYAHDARAHGAGAQVYKVVKGTDRLIARGFLHYSSFSGMWEFEGVAHTLTLKRTEGDAFIATMVAGVVFSYEKARSL